MFKGDVAFVLPRSLFVGDVGLGDSLGDPETEQHSCSRILTGDVCGPCAPARLTGVHAAVELVVT